MKYTASQLKEFKANIENKMEEAKQTCKDVREMLKSMDEHPTEDGEIASVITERDRLNLILYSTEKFIDKLQHALWRCANGTFGVCAVTGKTIPRERLMATPVATTLIDVKVQAKQTEGNVSENYKITFHD